MLYCSLTFLVPLLVLLAHVLWTIIKDGQNCITHCSQRLNCSPGVFPEKKAPVGFVAWRTAGSSLSLLWGTFKATVTSPAIVRSGLLQQAVRNMSQRKPACRRFSVLYITPRAWPEKLFTFKMSRDKKITYFALVATVSHWFFLQLSWNKVRTSRKNPSPSVLLQP